jgi:hypothetical protein
MLTELYYEIAIPAAVSTLAVVLVVLMLPDETLSQVEDWRARIHASMWRWPLTALFGFALAVTLWIVVDAARFLWVYHH